MNTERRQYLYLDTQMKQKSNNLDFMKFLAAWLVIVHHSFDLNVSKGEWIKVITGQQLDFGTVAVSLFFLASGLFIVRDHGSLCDDPAAWAVFYKQCDMALSAQCSVCSATQSSGRF